MTAIRDLLAAAVPPAPPTTVDVEKVISGGRRSARLRTAFAAAGTTGVVTGIALLSVALAGGRPPHGAPGPGAVPVRTGPATTQAEVDRVDHAVTAALTRLVPGTQLAREYGYFQPSPAPTGHCASCEPPAINLRYQLVTAQGTGRMYVDLGTPQKYQTSCDAPPLDGSPNGACAQTEREGTTVLDRSSDVARVPGMVWCDVTAIHPDGTVVRVYVSDQVNHSCLLTKEQVIALASDPTLTLYP